MLSRVLCIWLIFASYLIYLFIKIPSYWLFGSRQRILLDEQNTNAHYDLIEGTFPPGAQSPLHVHANYTETIIVLKGQVAIHTPGHELILKEGESYFIPQNIPHAVVNNSSSETFKALAIASPSGFARLIRSIGISDHADIDVSHNNMICSLQWRL